MTEYQPIKRICRVSGREFIIYPEDQKFYDMMGVNYPTLDPVERSRQRIAFGPLVTTVYKRKCDATGKELVTYYHPLTPAKIYDRDYWLSDDFDPKIYGRDFDFGRSFFEQFRDLLWAVPKFHAINMDGENSDYTLMGRNNKNCYLVCSFGCVDTMFSCVRDCREVVDCMNLYDCEGCYECVSCDFGYNLKFAQFSRQCRDSMFLYDCHHVSDCIMCVGLKHKQYCIKNRQLTKEEYERQKENFDTGSFQSLENMKKQFADFCRNFPVRENQNSNCQNVIGDFMKDSENCFMCFQGRNSRGCRYCMTHCNDQINCFDTGSSRSENCLNVGTRSMAKDCKFCHELIGGNNLEYCYEITATCNDMFGCVGIKTPSEYMILNKQYTKDKYFELKKKIIAYMKETGEYGEFFPMEMSLFPYHDSFAYEYWPIDERQVTPLVGTDLGLVDFGGKEHLKIHFRPFEKKDTAEQMYAIEDNIKSYCDEKKQHDLLTAILICEKTGRPYRIQPSELYFYIKYNLPIPRESFYARHPRRASELTRTNIYQRNCDHCGKDMATVFGKETEREVWCAGCYGEMEGK